MLLLFFLPLSFKLPLTVVPKLWLSPLPGPEEKRIVAARLHVAARLLFWLPWGIDHNPENGKKMFGILQ